MRRRFVLLSMSVLALLPATARAADWHLEPIKTPAKVEALDTVDNQVRVRAGGRWYAVERKGDRIVLRFLDAPAPPVLRERALPDGAVAHGSGDIRRAWLADPTTRYDHGVLGDKIEAGSVVIETRDGIRHTVSAGTDAVFEDLRLRLADFGDGHDSIVVVKSYLKKGSALAVIGRKSGLYEVIAETPPIGRPHRWLDPAGIADFTGDGKPGIALVRMPHVLGQLELWTYDGHALVKRDQMSGFANHIAGTRALNMAAVIDVDGDGAADLALPSLDRSRLRLVSFMPHPREFKSLPLPAKAVTNFGWVGGKEAPAVVFGLADGALVALTR
jgi:hypothetical protein